MRQQEATGEMKTRVSQGLWGSRSTLGACPYLGKLWDPPKDVVSPWSGCQGGWVDVFILPAHRHLWGSTSQAELAAPSRGQGMCLLEARVRLPGSRGASEGAGGPGLPRAQRKRPPLRESEGLTWAELRSGEQVGRRPVSSPVCK